MSLLELTNVKNVVVDGEIANKKESFRKFTYKLNEKAAQNKLIKGAKRNPFEVEENTSSINLIFNLGSWMEIVLPSITYWKNIKETDTCRVGDKIVKS